ncbi:MAG: serine/threonine-protein kinase [Phycisphaerales bacterium]
MAANAPKGPREDPLWLRTKAVVGEALELPEPQRSAFVEAACANDPALRSEARALLRASAAPAPALEDTGLPASVLADAIEPAPLADGASIGRYRIVRQIGAGGMGAVFEALDTTLNRTVALKLLTLGLASTGARRRFEGEALALARLDHPGIARVYEAGVHAAGQAVSIPYFAMAYVEDARALDAYCRESGLHARALLELFARVCDAVHHGHQKGVLHRDLKPSNILVDRAGNPKIIDFGVSRLLDAGNATQSTRAGDIMGTPAYLPPEAFEQGVQALDTRADVYALGVVFYEALSGATPFGKPGLTPVQVGQLVTGKPPAPLGTSRPECAGDIETVIAKAMAREPEDRYQSVEQLGADLRRVLRFEPILARPTPLLSQARLFARRNRTLVAAALLAALALILGVSGLAAGLARARASERRAREEAARAKQVSTFVMQMLRSASPFQGSQFQDGNPRSELFLQTQPWPSTATPGRAPTVGDLLFAATNHLESSFPDDPTLQADMAEALCATANRISDPRMLDFSRRAAGLLAQVYGNDDPRTLSARQLHYAQLVLNGYTGCLPDLQRDLALIRRLPQPENASLLRSAWSSIVTCQNALRRPQDATPILNAVRADMERANPEDSADKIRLDLAIIRSECGDDDPQRALSRIPALLDRARAVPTDQVVPATLDVMFENQYQLAMAGRLDAAMNTLAHGAAISTSMYGGMDQGTYEWWNNLYFIALLANDLPVAEYAAREQLRGAQAMLGPHSTYTTKAQGRLARTLLSQKKNLEEAERNARLAVDGAPDLLATGDGWALYHELLWAWAIRTQGEPDRALRIIQARAEIESAAGRPTAVNWVELVRCTLRAECEMDLAERTGDLAARASRIARLLDEADCWGEQLGRDWPSVRLAEAARERLASLHPHPPPRPADELNPR